MTLDIFSSVFDIFSSVFDIFLSNIALFSWIMIFFGGVMVPESFIVTILYVYFWGDEYTTRHAGRLRQLLCGSHLRSYFTLVALPWNLGFLIVYSLCCPSADPMFQGLMCGHVPFGIMLLVLNVWLAFLGEGYKNNFYRHAAYPVVIAYEEGRGVDTELLTDCLESLFLAAHRHNAIAVTELQSLVGREDELGAQARAVVQELQAKYSGPVVSEPVTE